MANRKKWIALVCAAVACLSLTSCKMIGGSGAAGPVDSAVLEAQPISLEGQPFNEEQYKQKISELMTQAQTIASALSGLNTENGTEQALQHLRGLKTPLQTFLSMDTVPDKYAKAHEQFKIGCEQYIKYVDLTIDFVEKNGMKADEAQAKEYQAAAQEYIQAAMDALSQGSTLASEADQAA